MSLTQEAVADLIQQCFQAKQQAYAPYSNFPVGAALLCEDGTVFKGCNVENASYGLTICAERVAICKAVTEGHRKFKAIAISSNWTDRHIVPCGMCRQTIMEFGDDIDLYMTKTDGTYKLRKIGDMLPDGFTPTLLREQK